MKDRNVKLVNEIFHSLQGEGRHTGMGAVFVRFSGCNLECPFCDTVHREGTPMTDAEILAEVNRYPAEWIILTGGEPALRIDREFIDLLHTTGKKVAIETNGTVPLPDNLDWVTCSPKSGISGSTATGPDGLPADTVRISHADEIKVVDVGQDLEPYFALPCRSVETLMYLQPCFAADPAECQQNTERTVGRVLRDPRWVLSLQTHRLLGIR